MSRQMQDMERLSILASQGDEDAIYALRTVQRRKHITPTKGLLLEATVPGPPVGKGRPRVTRTGHAYTPKKTRAWENGAALVFAPAWGGTEPAVGPLEVEVVAVKARRKTDKTPGRFLRIVKPDADNVTKCVLDALQLAGVIKDDSHVSIVRAISLHAAAGEDPCVEVKVWRLDSVEYAA